MEANKVDIKENYILHLDSQLLSILLMDHSSGKNIIWATDNYSSRGIGYRAEDYIEVSAVSGKHGNVVKPRTEKSQKEQRLRIRDKAEVFTPSWICNSQNNLVDEAWFGRGGVFNLENNNNWISTNGKVIFPEGKSWKDYVNDIRMEISCGEAPYLVSRYDTVTGDIIPIENRIGLLDRKLRIVSENSDNESDWYLWTKQAYKSVYGYDWQGDNVLIARENLLLTFADYYIRKFNTEPSKNLLPEIADIISWNIWQMDGLKYVIPNSCKAMDEIDYTLFGEEHHQVECEGCKKNNIYAHNGIYCIIKDWEQDKAVKFVSLIGKGYK